MDAGIELYLDLMKRILVNVIYQDPPLPASWYRTRVYEEQRRTTGDDWPSVAHTMSGLDRLSNVQSCTAEVLANGVPGHLLEAGVWRGGIPILMRAILKAYGVTDRIVWAVDSFEGVPDTGPSGHILDQKWALHESNNFLAVSAETVEDNFRRYGLWDDQVKLLKGWFEDTLPNAPIERLAILRLDGDLHKSTMDILVNLYPKLSVGGYIIIDDYGIESCTVAVDEFREKEAIEAEIRWVDDTCVYWRRER